MKKILTVTAILAFLLLMVACASDAEAGTDFVLPTVEETVVDDSAGVVLDKAVDGTSGNFLADSIGPVTVTVKEDRSYTANEPIPGGQLAMVEFLGEECLRVKKNFNYELRVAFVLDEATSLAGYTTLSFDVAGVDGAGGVYNCGLLYTDANGQGLRTGSFYVSDVSSTEWTSVEMNLATDETWGKNFSEDRTLYAIQFWSNATDYLYIKNLTLK